MRVCACTRLYAVADIGFDSAACVLGVAVTRQVERSTPVFTSRSCFVAFLGGGGVTLEPLEALQKARSAAAIV